MWGGGGGARTDTWKAFRDARSHLPVELLAPHDKGPAVDVQHRALHPRRRPPVADAQPREAPHGAPLHVERGPVPGGRGQTAHHPLDGAHALERLGSHGGVQQPSVDGGAEEAVEGVVPRMAHGTRQAPTRPGPRSRQKSTPISAADDWCNGGTFLDIHEWNLIASTSILEWLSPP